MEKYNHWKGKHRKIQKISLDVISRLWFPVNTMANQCFYMTYLKCEVKKYRSRQKAPRSESGYHKASLPRSTTISISPWPVQCHAMPVPNCQGLSNTEKRVEGSPNNYASTAIPLPGGSCNKIVYY